MTTRIIQYPDGSFSLSDAQPFVQPASECTHCGTAGETLTPLTVAGGGVVLDEQLCPRCIRALAASSEFVAV